MPVTAKYLIAYFSFLFTFLVVLEFCPASEASTSSCNSEPASAYNHCGINHVAEAPECPIQTQTQEYKIAVRKTTGYIAQTANHRPQ